jgi:hypothetical protein
MAWHGLRSLLWRLGLGLDQIVTFPIEIEIEIEITPVRKRMRLSS